MGAAVVIRIFAHAASVPALLAEGWTLVYEVAGGGHPVVRLTGAVLQRDATQRQVPSIAGGA